MSRAHGDAVESPHRVKINIFAACESRAWRFRVPANACRRVDWIRVIPGLGAVERIVDPHESRPDVVCARNCKSEWLAVLHLRVDGRL